MNNSAIRTLEILEFLAESKKAMGISELSRELNIPKSSVFDIVYALLKKGFVEIENEQLKNFKLGIRAFQVGSAYINRTDLFHVAHPLLEQLKNDTGETAYLAIENKGKIVYLDKVESDTPILSTCNIGSTNLMHLTGLGKAILAAYSDDKVKEIIGTDKLEVRTKNTIANYEELRNHLEQIREKGYSFDDREDTEIVCCIAAPIYDRTNQVIAAISVSMLYSKITEDKRSEISQKVINAAFEISRKLGFSRNSLYA